MRKAVEWLDWAEGARSGRWTVALMAGGGEKWQGLGKKEGWLARRTAGSCRS